MVGYKAWEMIHQVFCTEANFFCNHFEKLWTVLFEAKLIINNAILTYVYQNTIKTCWTPNHLLFGRQLSYSSNITSTVVMTLVMNLTVLSNTTDKINRTSNNFLERCMFVNL